MKLMKVLFCQLLALSSLAQNSAPPVYINFVSHNEPLDGLDNFANYGTAKSNAIALAQILQPYGAKWNLQTCDAFVKGALTIEGYSNNVFRTLATQYSSTVEIDPRSKTTISGNNIADTYHLLDSAGANPTNTLGGFIYYSAGTPAIDWPDYLGTKYSQSPNYPTVAWNCNIIWGAGSPNHAYDFYNWGIWKPQASSTNATTNSTLFYTHNAANNLWYIGSGCPPAGTNEPTNSGSFDPTDNVSDVTGPLKSFIDSIQNHLLPWDRQYNYSITINQSDFGTTLFNKLTAICDSIQDWGTSKIQWKFLTEKLSIFEAWSTTYSHDFSQWACGEDWPIAGLEENAFTNIKIHPNPSSGIFHIEFTGGANDELVLTNIYGQVMKTITPTTGDFILDLSNEPVGIYFVLSKNKGRISTQMLVKE